jgi:hypothetical protein
MLGATTVKIKNNKFLILCLVLLGTGIICLVFENHFYQYVDEDGYLRESLFLPIGAFSFLLGGIGLVVMLARKLWAVFRSD